MIAFRQLSVSRRLGWLVGSAVLAMLVLVAILMVSERSLILQERQASVRQAVETAHGVIAHFHAQASKGALTEDEAKQRAMAALQGLRYDEKEYFWVNDMTPRMLMHPINKKLMAMETVATVKVPNGKALFVEMVDVVKAHGAGFVDYMWPQPGSDQPVAKISYVKGYAPWGWVIGSGIYLDDVNRIFYGEMLQQGIVILVIMLVTVLISVVIARSISISPSGMRRLVVSKASLIFRFRALPVIGH